MELQSELVWNTSYVIKCIPRWCLSGLWISWFCRQPSFDNLTVPHLGTNFIFYPLSVKRLFQSLPVSGFLLISNLNISKPVLHPNTIYIFVLTLPFILNNSAPCLVLSVICTERNHNFSFKLNSYDGLFMSLIILAWSCTSVPLQGETRVSWASVTELDMQTSVLYSSESKRKPIHVKCRNY